MPRPHRLVLVRHATAVPDGVDSDAARSLTPQGHAEAAALASWLKAEDLLGEAVVCSPAVRTRQTWADVAERTGHGVLIDMDPTVYESSVENLLDVVRRTDDLVRTLVVVGHAPGVPLLAHDLCRGVGEVDALDELARGFAPASCAVVEFDGSWADLDLGQGVLVQVRPGTLRGRLE